jgi:N-acetylglucosaminyl-diphospho-decaprenol L-rhamnosyltransferase
VVIVNHETAADVEALLTNLEDARLEVIVVDNASTRPPAVQASNARLVQAPYNAGWACACNAGATIAHAPVLAFVNPDARPSPADLRALAQSLADGSVGAVAPRFLNSDGSPQAFYFRFPSVVAGLFCFLPTGQRIDRWIGSPFIRHRTYASGEQPPAAVDQPGAACLLVRRDDFAGLGGFDEGTFLFFADTDLCLRLRERGRRVLVRWDVDVVHAGSSSVRLLPPAALREHVQRDYLVYLRRHHGRAAVAVTKAAALVLSGLLPALWQLLRLRPRSSWEQLRSTLHVVWS